MTPPPTPFQPTAPAGTAVTLFVWWILVELQSLLPLPSIQLSAGWRWGGGAIFLADALLTIVWSLRILATATRDGSLATSGPYAFIRHPIYAALLWSGTAGVAFAASSWLVLLGAAPLSVLWSLVSQADETLLEERFGDTYRAYASTTGQLFPRLFGLMNRDADNNHDLPAGHD